MQRPDEMQGGLKWTSMLPLLFLVVAVCFARYLLEGHVGFTLWDEGYLWYGVQQVLHGGVPIRDFMSYDPGRYYWVGSLLWLFHAHGIVAVRVATMAFSALGLICAGWLVLREGGGSPLIRFAWCAFAIVMCVLWMVPWWKSFDEAISIILIASLARLFVRPSPSRFLQHGVVVGLAAVLGRNHGFYGVAACVLAAPVLMLSAETIVWRRCISAWVVGVMLGFAPILIALALDYRFAVMFWDSIRFMLFEYKGTNLPLPVPWPWTVPIGHASLLSLIWPWLVGCFFVALPVFCIGGAVTVVYRLRREHVILNPVFAACVATAIPYLNVAFSRADAGHLAGGIFPCLIGFLIWPWRGRIKVIAHWIGVPLLVVTTLWVVLPLHPGYLMHTQPNWQAQDVGGDAVWMDAATAAQVEDIKDLAKRHVPAAGTLLAVPVWPGAYALLGVRSPVWEIYPLFPRSDKFQQEEIARLQRAAPQLVLVYDLAVDGRDDLHYAHTHPLIWRYITTRYHQVPGPSREPQLKVYLPGAQN